MLGLACALLVVSAGAMAAAQPAAGGRIRNPFYERPAWRLWALDPRPVNVVTGDGKSTVGPPDAAERLYPVFPADWEQSPRRTPRLEKLNGAPEVAGFWDDCYLSLDNGHSRLRMPRGQFIDAGRVPRSVPHQPRLALGVNFTSQSYARRGRHIVDDFENNHATERFFLFANCVRATPSHRSYVDDDPRKVHDDYDALFAHSYHSIGQSSSEVHALYKMMLAGACMPRRTKNLLKLHGAYANTLMAVFKAALPYTDQQGEPLPYENELRHRPAYSSDGNVGHPHFCPANVHYHGYDEARHVHNMADLARSLDVPPPVAILKVLEVAVRNDGALVAGPTAKDARLKSVNKTLVRVWGRPGETIALKVDIQESYDLLGRPWTAAWHVVYPNQKNVRVEAAETEGVYIITARHDPALPKGRIPVMLVLRNGSGVPSNPAFVNFYWPEEGELADYPHLGRTPAQAGEQKEVTRNLRPTVDFGFEGDSVHCRPGETVSFPVTAQDPEGYPVRVYRRPGEVGQIDRDRFVFHAPEDSADVVHAVHFIFSDGTGGYAGKRVKILVSERADSLPADWHVTTLGIPQAPGGVTYSGGELLFTGTGSELQGRTSDGVFAYRKGQGDIDFEAQITDLSVEESGSVELGLTLRQSLEDSSPYALLSLKQDGGAEAATAYWGFRPSASRWGRTMRAAQSPAPLPARLRVVRRGDVFAAFVCAGEGVWEQVWSEEVAMGDTVYGGIAVAGQGTAICRMAESPPSIPIVRLEGAKGSRSDSLQAPVKVRLIPELNAPVYVKLDGPDGQTASGRYEGPIELEQSGRYELRVRYCADGGPQEQVRMAFDVSG